MHNLDLEHLKLSIDLIKHFEGFSSNIYCCPAGIKTIGYGHAIKKNEKFNKAISIDEAVKLLIFDIKYILKRLNHYIYVKLNNNQLNAIISFCYNLGLGAFQRSTLRMKVNEEEFTDASDEFEKWCYIGAIKSRGLLRRRLAEKKIFLG